MGVGRQASADGRARPAGMAGALAAGMAGALVCLGPAAVAAAADPTAKGSTPAGTAGSEAPASLPPMSQRLAPGQGCAPRSTTRTSLTPWHQSFLRPERVWPLSRGSGVVVGVVDTGVEPTTPALAGRVQVAPAGGARSGDCVGHGTFLAGLIAAREQPGLAGIAPEAVVLSLTATDASGNPTPDRLAAGIRAAVDGGARIVLVGTPVYAPSSRLELAVRYAVGHGVLVVAPATADDQQRAGAVYPADLPGVLSVGDIGPTGAPPQSGVAGAAVDLAAPGDAMLSVGPRGPGYYTGTGASYAAAFVAGTAALVLSYHPSLTPVQLVHRLEVTAYHPGTALPDPKLGYGTVDPVAAVSTVLPEETGSPAPRPSVRTPLSMPAAVDRSADRAGLTVAAVAALLATLTAAAGVVIPRGRRRGWHPGPDPVAVPGQRSR